MPHIKKSEAHQPLTKTANRVDRRFQGAAARSFPGMGHAMRKCVCVCACVRVCVRVCVCVCVFSRVFLLECTDWVRQLSSCTTRVLFSHCGGLLPRNLFILVGYIHTVVWRAGELKVVLPS